MNENLAQQLLYVIAFAGAIAWVAGLQFLLRSIRSAKDDGPSGLEFGPGGPPPENLVFGGAEVEGRPETLSSKAAAALAAGLGQQLGPVRILDRTDEHVVFEAGDSAKKGILKRGQFRFSSVNAGRARIDYGVEISGGRGLVLGGAIFLFLGLIALVGGFFAIQWYVLPNPNPAVRGQAFQMFQVVHFLWPPFLFGALYRMRRRVVRDAMDTLVHNLPYRENPAV